MKVCPVGYSSRTPAYVFDLLSTLDPSAWCLELVLCTWRPSLLTAVPALPLVFQALPELWLLFLKFFPRNSTLDSQPPNLADRSLDENRRGQG